MTDTTPDLAREVDPEELLDAWLEASLEEIGDEPKDAEQADRLLWALRTVRQRRDEIVETAQARMQLISTWASQQMDQLDARAEHLERVLAGWTHAEHERTNRKTISLPAGKLRVSALRQRTLLDERMADYDVVMAVRRYVPAAIKVAESVRRDDVKAVTEPGDPIDDYPDVPEGYRAYTAVMADSADSFVVVEGFVYLVPVEGRAGLKFEAVTQ